MVPISCHLSLVAAVRWLWWASAVTRATIPARWVRACRPCVHPRTCVRAISGTVRSVAAMAQADMPVVVFVTGNDKKRCVPCEGLLRIFHFNAEDEWKETRERREACLACWSWEEEKAKNCIALVLQST